MIMKMALSATILVSMSIISTHSNPVKVAFTLLGTSMALFLSIYMQTGCSWMPLLLLLIFMGGVLMMFMILSSVLPNEPSFKSKLMSKMSLTFLTVTLVLGTYTTSKSQGSEMVKSLLSENNTFLALTLAMLYYFFFTIYIVTQDKASMRSVV